MRRTPSWRACGRRKASPFFSSKRPTHFSSEKASSFFSEKGPPISSEEFRPRAEKGEFVSLGKANGFSSVANRFRPENWPMDFLSEKAEAEAEEIRLRKKASRFPPPFRKSVFGDRSELDSEFADFRWIPSEKASQYCFFQYRPIGFFLRRRLLRRLACAGAGARSGAMRRGPRRRPGR